jgi:hypothetical protein
MFWLSWRRSSCGHTATPLAGLWWSRSQSDVQGDGFKGFQVSLLGVKWFGSAYILFCASSLPPHCERGVSRAGQRAHQRQRHGHRAAPARIAYSQAQSRARCRGAGDERKRWRRNAAEQITRHDRQSTSRSRGRRQRQRHDNQRQHYPSVSYISGAFFFQCEMDTS